MGFLALFMNRWRARIDGWSCFNIYHQSLSYVSLFCLLSNVERYRNIWIKYEIPIAV